ncbi:MAG: helix-turn-helix transcriptional regulator [Verrucomicrobia bacterium]|nr:helix-turn-helix transcriptional regulator [Verrucomicrobiota bacterium]MCH8511574.1 helix-turn-helix transcriptional regulator [Kiritimatiellia bacterium]
MPNPEDILNAMMKIMQEERLAKGLNYEDFSAAAGLHRTTIPRYENGSVVPTVLAAIKMAQALNMNFSEVMIQAETFCKNRNP